MFTNVNILNSGPSPFIQTYVNDVASSSYILIRTTSTKFPNLELRKPNVCSARLQSLNSLDHFNVIFGVGYPRVTQKLLTFHKLIKNILAC